MDNSEYILWSQPDVMKSSDIPLFQYVLGPFWMMYRFCATWSFLKVKFPEPGSLLLFHEVNTKLPSIFIPGRKVSVAFPKLCHRLVGSWSFFRTRFPESMSCASYLFCRWRFLERGWPERSPSSIRIQHEVTILNGQNSSGIRQWVVSIGYPHNGFRLQPVIPYTNISLVTRLPLGVKNPNSNVLPADKRVSPSPSLIGSFCLMVSLAAHVW